MTDRYQEPHAVAESRAEAPVEAAPFDEDWGGPSSSQELRARARRYLMALRRRLWIVVLALAMGLGGAFYVWDTAETRYTAVGALWIQESAGQSGPIRTEELLGGRAWIDLLRSFAVLDTVVVEMGLYLNTAPENRELFEDFSLAEQFAPGRYALHVSESGGEFRLLREGVEVDQGEVGDPVGRELGFRWTPPPGALEPGRQVPFGVVTPRDASRQLSDRLRANMDPPFLRVQLEGADPERIARVLNALMDQHIRVAADLKRGNMDERTRILRDQLSLVEEELAAAERALEGFRVETITLPSDPSTPIAAGLELTRGPVFSDFFEKKVELEQLERDRDRLMQLRRAVPDSGVQAAALEIVPAVGSNSELRQALADLTRARTELRQLRQRYTDQHPPVRELIDQIRVLEEETVPNLIEALVSRLDGQIERLRDEIDAASGELTEIPPRSIEEARLRRRVGTVSNLHADLRQRYESARLAAASSIPDVRILDRATVPQVPENDERARLALMVLLGCLGVGVAAVLGLDHFDPRVRYPSDVTAEMGLRILGGIPKIRTNGRKGSTAQQALEAFRELRVNVRYAYGEAGPLVLTVTSPEQNEGKSLVTANLGMAFADMGRKTLVIDGDTRRGDLHTFLGAERRPGLTDILKRKVSGQEAFQETEHPRLFFIGSGTRVADAPEALGTSLMNRVLTAARRSFDVVLVDSPPLGAGSDAVVLGALTGNLLLVIRNGRSNKELATAKLESLQSVPVRVLGAVLNDFNPGGLAYRYYYSYLPDYEIEAEDEGGEEGRDESVGETLLPTGA